MIAETVCVVRPPKADLEVLSRDTGNRARATRTVVAPEFQRGKGAADSKRAVDVGFELLVRQYSCCRAEARRDCPGEKTGAPAGRN